MHILFVTRKYPPSTGGMQNAAYELHKALAADHNVTLVRWGGDNNKWLPVVYPWLLLQALWKGLRDRPTAIYLQDGIMAPLGWVLKLILRRPTVMTIHGLEATYTNPLYRIMVTPFIPRQTQLVAVSNETKQMVLAALPRTNPLVIFNGVTDSFYHPMARDEALQLLSHHTTIPVAQLRRSKILHTNGRLVRRKGVFWFVDKVLPQLVAQNPFILYLVSGEGKDREMIEAVIADRGLTEHVKLLGRIPDQQLHLLYNMADIFAMPNVPVANDMEGFGLVALEAASCGTTVVASRLEGIQDAIIDGQSGLLLKPGDVHAYVETILRELKRRTLQPEAVRTYTLAHYSWAETGRQYETVLRQVGL